MTDTKKKKQVPAIMALINSQEDAIMTALSATPLRFEPFITALRTEFAGNEGLQKCLKANPASVLNAIMHAAQLGLQPGRVHKHFAMVPFKEKGLPTCKPIIEYRGYLHLAERSDRVEHVDVDVVYRHEVENKTWTYDRTTGVITHVFDVLECDEERRIDEFIVAAYCVVKVKGRDKPTPCVLRLKEIHARRARSPAWLAAERKGKDSPWHTDYIAQCKKSAVRALLDSGRIPLGSAEGQIAEALKDDPEVIKPADAVVVESEFESLDKDPLPAEPEEREPGEDG